MAEAALYPGARWTPLGAQTETRMTSHDVICAHTMAGYLVSTDRYFRISNGEGYWGTESHFGMGGEWGPDLGGGLDGAVWQWQDLAYGADANLDGKRRVISIETADNAVRPIAPWTPAQVDGLVDLIDWLCSPAAHAQCPPSWTCHEVGIPRALIPDSKPGRRGIGYHAQGAAELVPGGEEWSTTLSKDCPTAARIAQLKTIIVPRVAARAPASVIEEENPMADLSDADITRLRGAVGGGVLDALRTGEGQKILTTAVAKAVAPHLAALQAISTDVAGLDDPVDPDPAPDPAPPAV